MTSGTRKVIFLVLLLGVLAAGFQYMIRPANRKLADARQAVRGKRTKLAEFEKKAPMRTEDLNQQLSQVNEAVRFFESRLPPTSEIHKVLEQVTVIVQKQGLEPKTIRTLTRKEDNRGYVEQPMKMELVGNFNAFYSFLLEIEKLPRIMKIRELKLERDKDGDGQITADLIISIFFQNTTA
jgi:Tfp pilus assembly protein PilO